MNEHPDLRGPNYRLPSPPPPDPTGWQEIRRRARSTLWPPRPQAWAGLLAVLVAAAGVSGLRFQATLPGRLPSETDWRAAASLLAREARPGDAVALAPPWAERAREVLPERLPSRPDVPLPVLALPSYAAGEEDLPGVRRVWLVSLPDAPGGPGRAAADLAARASAVEGPVRLGRLDVTRFDLAAPVLPAWSLSGRLATATVDAGGGSVAPEIREVAFLPRSCVVTRWPGLRPAPATIRLPPLLLGTSLRGRVALVGDPAPGEPPVTVTVRVDGAEVARAEASASRPEGAPLRVDGARLPPGPHEVTVEIAPSGPVPRGVCVELLSLP